MCALLHSQTVCLLELHFSLVSLRFQSRLIRIRQLRPSHALEGPGMVAHCIIRVRIMLEGKER